MTNADPQELAKFSELAHRWWDPESEFRPLHQINPLRLDWIDALAPLARQARARRRLRRRHPGRVDGAARRRACSASTWPTKPLKVAQLHALEAGTANVEYREVAAEALAAEQPGAASTSSPAWRCSSTCPIRRRSCAPAPRWSSRAAGCSSRPSTATPRRSCSPSSAPSTCCKLLPKGTHEYATLHPPERTGALVPRRRPRARRDTRGMEYNPLTRALLAVGATPASTT